MKKNRRKVTIKSILAAGSAASILGVAVFFAHKPEHAKFVYQPGHIQPAGLVFLSLTESSKVQLAYLNATISSLHNIDGCNFKAFTPPGAKSSDDWIIECDYSGNISSKSSDSFSFVTTLNLNLQPQDGPVTPVVVNAKISCHWQQYNNNGYLEYDTSCSASPSDVSVSPNQVGCYLLNVATTTAYDGVVLEVVFFPSSCPPSGH